VLRPVVEATVVRIRYALFTSAVALLVLFLTWPLLLRPIGPIVLVADLAVVAAVPVTIWLHARNACVYGDAEGGLCRTTSLGRLRRYPPGSAVRADRYTAIGRYGMRNPYLSFIGSDDRELFRIPARDWDTSGLQPLCRHTGIDITGSYQHETTTLQRWRERPGAFAASTRRGLALGGVVVIAAAAWLLAYRQGPE
jgi:hypothetical protein